MNGDEAEEVNVKEEIDGGRTKLLGDLSCEPEPVRTRVEATVASDNERRLDDINRVERSVKKGLRRSRALNVLEWLMRPFGLCSRSSLEFALEQALSVAA